MDAPPVLPDRLRILFFIFIILDLAEKKMPVAHPLSHVKELPFRTPPLTFDFFKGVHPEEARRARLKIEEE